MKKIFAFVLALSMLCAMTGCDKNEGSASTQESSTSSVEESSSTPSAPDSSSEESTGSTSGPTAGQAEFDFDEAVKNITLFGNKISLPCAWEDLGNDYSHDEFYVPSGDDLLCGLKYKGKEIGSVVFGNCSIADSDNVEEKQIVSLIIGLIDYGYPYDDYEKESLERGGFYSGLLEFELDGLSMQSTESDIKELLGEPDSTSDGVLSRHDLDYNYNSGYLRFCINEKDARKGRILEFYVYVGSY